MGTPHRLSLIALSGQIQFCATRHHPDVRLSLLTASILSFDGLVAYGQTKNPAYIAVSRVWKFYGLRLPAYLRSIQCGFLTLIRLGYAKAEHTIQPAMTCRFRDRHHRPTRN